MRILIVTENYQYYKNGAEFNQLTDAEGRMTFVGVGANLLIVYKDTLRTHSSSITLPYLIRRGDYWTVFYVIYFLWRNAIVREPVSPF